MPAATPQRTALAMLPIFSSHFEHAMIEQFFSETFLELSDLELPHWLTAAGSVLVIVGTIGAGIEPACEGSETATKTGRQRVPCSPRLSRNEPICSFSPAREIPCA